MVRHSYTLVLAIATVVYVCFGALSTAGTSVWPWFALVGLPLMLVEGWRRTNRPRRGEDRVEPTARMALRACLLGIAWWLAARTAPAGRPAFDAVANLGAGTTSVAALVALARIDSLRGLLQPPPTTRSFDAAAFVGLLWGIATAIPAKRALLPAQVVRLDPLAVDYATTTAAAGTLLVLTIASLRVRWLRRLELGVADRAVGALAISVTTLLVVVPAAWLDVAPPDRVLPAGVLIASLFGAWTASTPEPTTIASALRGILAVVVLGAPTVLLAGLLAREAPDHAGAIVLAATAIAVFVGLVARAVARPLGPEQSRWLDAIDAAARGALQPEPDAAVQAALYALSRATATPSARPELWRNDPQEVLSVDIAGYLHTDEAEAPERIFDLALQEPERTLRAEVLKALEVRRPEVRPLLDWFDRRHAFSATVVLDEEGPQGFLLLPRGARVAPMTLEEARAIRILTDRLSSLMAVSSALARSRERELRSAEQLERQQTELQRLRGFLEANAGQHRAHAERMARQVQRATYSPAARLARQEVETAARSGGPLTLVTPVGCDPSGWAAIAHLESPRNQGPLVFVDGASGTDHDLDLWEDPTRSPTHLATHGTLVLLEVAALPVAVQGLAARQLARQRQAARDSSVAAPGLVATVHAPVTTLLEQQRLAPALAQLLGNRAVIIPPLAERAEDLRALILDALVRAGMRRHGEPLGIEDRALRLLLEHSWPGNEAELTAAVARIAGQARDLVVSLDDLTAANFAPEAGSAPTLTPPPAATRRRPRSRAVSRR